MYKNRISRLALMATTCLFPLTASAQDGEIFTLGEIVIKAMNDGGEGVSKTEAMNTAGSRVAINPEDLPRSVAIIPDEYYESRGARTMEETLSYTASVVTEAFGQDDRYDEYLIRGFNSQNVSNYRDGLPLRSIDFAAWRTEPFGLESVNVLRGPTSDLYGINEPGGVVNGVSKRPSFTQRGEVRATVSTDQGAQVGVDFTGPLSDTLAYRIVGLAGRSGSNFEDVDSSRIYIAPSLTWTPTDSTKLTFYGQYQKDDVADNYVQLPEYGTRKTNPGGQYTPDLYVGNPDYNSIETTQNFVGYEFEHDINDQLTFSSRARYAHNDWANNTEYGGLFVNSALLAGFASPPSAVDTAAMIKFDTDQEAEQLSFDNALVYDFGTAHGEGSIAVGLDHYRADSLIDISSAYAGELNLRTGARTNLFGAMFPAALPSRTKTDIRQTGLYVSGAADIAPSLKLSGGVRVDDIEYSASGFSTTPATGFMPQAFAYEVSDRVFSANVGLAYEITDELMVYGSLAKSNNVPPLGQTVTRQALDIEESQTIEAGLKFVSANGATDFTLAVFRTEKKNATFPVSGTLVPNAMQQVGKVLSQGVEIEGIHDFNNGFSLFGTLAYTDAKVSDDPTLAGKRIAHVPRYSASLFLQYEVPSIAGLAMGAGVRYTGDRYSDVQNNFKVDSLTVFDASVSYEWDDWKAQLAARNLTNKRQAAFCRNTDLTPSALNPALAVADPFSTSCLHNAGREISLTLSRQF